MKKAITILIVVFIAAGSYWIGYSNTKREAFWTEFSHSLGLAQILRSSDGLTEQGKENLNKISDMWLYGYFSTSQRPQKKELKHSIEDALAELIEWKQKNGFSVGHQEPLVQVQITEESIQDEKVVSDPMVEQFTQYKHNLDVFIEAQKIKIQSGSGSHH